MIWQHSPKTKRIGKKWLITRTQMAILSFDERSFRKKYILGVEKKILISMLAHISDLKRLMKQTTNTDTMRLVAQSINKATALLEQQSQASIRALEKQERRRRGNLRLSHDPTWRRIHDAGKCPDVPRYRL